MNTNVNNFNSKIGRFNYILSEDENKYKYEFSVLSMRTSKPSAHAHYGKLTLSRPRPPI